MSTACLDTNNKFLHSNQKKRAIQRKQSAEARSHNTYHIRTTNHLRNWNNAHWRLGEGEASGVVRGEDLLDRVDVGGGSQVDASVVLHGSLHDSPSGAFHGVVQTRVHDVLL